MSEISDFFDGMAPSWDERGRHDENLIDALLSSCMIRPGDRVLDLGCGTGVISKKLSLLSKSGVLCMDASEKMIAIAKEKYRDEKLLSFIQVDFYSFAGEGFDVIVCFDAYPHFVDVASFKKKAFDLLKNQGRLCILHDLSRKALEHCHSGHASTLSRISIFVLRFSAMLLTADAVIAAATSLSTVANSSPLRTELYVRF